MRTLVPPNTWLIRPVNEVTSAVGTGACSMRARRPASSVARYAASEATVGSSAGRRTYSRSDTSSAGVFRASEMVVASRKDSRCPKGTPKPGTWYLASRKA
jgi:hypothetical protein